MTNGQDATAGKLISPITEGVTETQWKAVFTLAVATLIIASEMTLAAFALPLISDELGVTAAATAWVLLAYTLPLVALAIPAGRWVDGADVRLVFLLSLALVGLASVVAAVATSFEMLMVGRVLQGLASALYLAVYMPVVSTTVKPAQRGRAISVIATIMMLGSVALAPLGGVVAESLGWRAVFLIKMPLLALALWLGTQTLPLDVKRVSLRDRLPLPNRSMLWETFLIGGAVTALLIAFEWVEQRPLMAFLLIIFSVSVLMGWARLKASQPVLALAAKRRFGLPALSLMLVAALIGLMSFILPFFMVDVMGRSPESLSIALLGFVLAAALVSPVAGTLADRFGAINIATLGAGLTVLGLLTLVSLDASASLFELVVRTAAVGIGMAIFNAPVMATMLEAAPPEMMGTASGISTVARMLGSTVGPAVAALAWSMSGGGLAGMQNGVWALATLALLGFLALLWARRSGSHAVDRS